MITLILFFLYPMPNMITERGCRPVARGGGALGTHATPFDFQGALLPTAGSTFLVKTARIAQFSLQFSKFLACGGL